MTWGHRGGLEEQKHGDIGLGAQDGVFIQVLQDNV